MSIEAVYSKTRLSRRSHRNTD